MENKLFKELVEDHKALFRCENCKQEVIRDALRRGIPENELFGYLLRTEAAFLKSAIKEVYRLKGRGIL